MRYTDLSLLKENGNKCFNLHLADTLTIPFSRSTSDLCISFLFHAFFRAILRHTLLSKSIERKW